MEQALKVFDRVPKWIVYLTVLIVPGGLLIAPVVVLYRQRRSLAAKAVQTARNFAMINERRAG
jgi:hypothetical protein